jgi:hypothetical protein
MVAHQELSRVGGGRQGPDINTLWSKVIWSIVLEHRNYFKEHDHYISTYGSG